MTEYSGCSDDSKGVQRLANLRGDCKDSLLTVIDEQIIPRLLNVQKFFTTNAVPQMDETSGTGLPEVEAFSQHCLSGDGLKAHQIVDALTDRGMTQERIFMELITPAARRLGVLWEQDLCDFTQVTCGLAMMHQVIYRLGYQSPAGQSEAGTSERIMLACAPGSQHFLGLTIVADFSGKPALKWSSKSHLQNLNCCGPWATSGLTWWASRWPWRPNSPHCPICWPTCGPVLATPRCV